MSCAIQVCLYNTDPDFSVEMRSEISSINFLRLVAETHTPEQLAALLADNPVNLIFFNLDPDRRAVIEVIDQVSTRFPDVAMIALGTQTDPDSILAPIRAGCDQFVCKPLNPSELATVVSRVASKRLLSRTKSRCVAVTGASGGVGATSIACNLAVEIAHQTEKACALADLDCQFGVLSVNFDCEPKYTIYDLADTSGQIDRSVLASVMTTLPGNVHLLARPHKIEQYDVVTGDVVQHVMDLLKSVYETIVLDVPRRVDTVTLPALAQADVVMIVCQLLVPSIRNATRLYEALMHAGISEERLEVVVNRGDAGGGRITAQDIESTIRKPVFAVIPNDYQYVARSLDLGRPIAAAEKSSPVRTAIQKMARRVLGEGDANQGKGRRGLLSRFLSR